MEKDNDVISKAIQGLKNGFLIVYPTDTLYALGADVFNEKAVEKVFKIKKRPLSIPLPVAVSDLKMLGEIAIVNDKAKKLSAQFLPGPLTLILKKKNNIPDLITSGSEKVAVRIPGDDVALKILSNFGPVTVTSANVHGKKPSGIIKEIRMQLKESDVAVYMNYGILQGQPSTIVDVTSENIKIIREGEISKKQISDVI